MAKNKFPFIPVKLGDLVGIEFSKMYLNFHVKISIITLLVHNLLENWGSGLVTGVTYKV